MTFLRKYVQRHPVRTQRFLEVLPGVISWSLILFPIWGSFVVPSLVAYYIIIFAVYWLYRSITLAVLSVSAFFTIRASSAYDWIGELKQKFPKRYRQVHHLIIIPTYKEPLKTLDKTLESLTQQTFPLKNLHIMVSFEDREGRPAREKAKKLIKKYQDKFGHLLTTFHPDIEGEVKGKSSNTAWGARQAKRILIDQKELPLEKFTVTSEDADARFHPSYFSAITYEFLTLKNPYNVVWQGAVMFYNNIWEVPAPIRVLASMFSVFQMYILKRADRLINFSTYTTTLKHVVEINYWDTDVIPEDYRLFFKSFFAKKGEFYVRPIFLPIYADAAQAKTFWETMVNQYEQLKRWAWGVSDDAYIIKMFILSEDIPFTKKFIRVLKTVEDHFLWPVHWFAVTVAAFFPTLLNPHFSRTALGHNLSQVTSTLLTLSLVSLLIIFIIDALSRPAKPNGRSILSYITQPLEFVLLPVIGFFFSALPGIDAHTRLMLGKYIEYRVTEKV